MTSKISILMPVKNGETFLPQAIKEIESNASIYDEIIIVDDGSQDRTSLLLRDWSRENSAVRVINNPKSGLVEALNLGIRESSNNWIARFDVDDRYKSDRLALQKRLITNTVAAIFCDYEFFSIKGKSLGSIPSPVYHQPSVMSLPFSQQTPHPGVMFNKTAVQSVGSYRTQDFPAEDISLWLRLARIGEIVSVPEILLNYRLSQNSISGQNRRLAKRLSYNLVNEIGINTEEILFCFETWRNFFELYSIQNLGAERSVLFYRNLMKAAQISRVSESQLVELREMRRYLKSDFRHGLAILDLAINKSKRQIYRSF